MIPRCEIREPLAVVHMYAMLGAGVVRRRREEALAAENEIIERYAQLSEQREALLIVLETAYRYYPKDTPMSESMRDALDWVHD